MRGRESVEASLGAFVAGELMDGDNRVECEDGVRRAIIRRTCLSTLPNLLILHLKRFDLDYTTFETVKLNSRCAFPVRTPRARAARAPQRKGERGGGCGGVAARESR